MLVNSKLSPQPEVELGHSRQEKDTIPIMSLPLEINHLANLAQQGVDDLGLSLGFAVGEFILTIHRPAFPQAFGKARTFEKCLEDTSVADVHLRPLLHIHLTDISGTSSEDPGFVLDSCCAESDYQYGLACSLICAVLKRKNRGVELTNLVCQSQVSNWN